MRSNSMNRRGFSMLIAASAFPGVALAQGADWPSRMVKVVTPAPPSGSLDRIARILAEDFAKAFGKPFIVENKPGAGSTIGTAAVAAAPADGYTLLTSGVFNAITPALYAKLPYTYLDDFIHVVPLMQGPNVLVVRPDSPYNSLGQLVAAAKANPGTLTYASAGSGTSGHLTMELFGRSAGIDITHVPYKGSAPALQDVLGGQVNMIATNQDAVLPLVKAGKLRAIGVTSAQRNPVYPSVPTFAESGFASVLVTSWGALAVRRGTPASVVDKLRAVAKKTLLQDHVRQPLEADGWVFFDVEPAPFEAFVRSETERWGQIIRSAGIQPQQ